ncbi:MAG: GerMN domain-containing protein [Candidatus Magasanikbacteria bacterium]
MIKNHFFVIIIVVAILIIGLGFFGYKFSGFLTESKVNDSVELIKLKVFFINSQLDPGVSCVKVFSVERFVTSTPAVGLAALQQLLVGPTKSEKAGGFGTTINPGVTVQKLTIENGIARVDFNDELDRQAGGSCRVSAIRAQIEATLKQFSTVKEVIISINGQSEDILQP